MGFSTGKYAVPVARWVTPFNFAALLRLCSCAEWFEAASDGCQIGVPPPLVWRRSQTTGVATRAGVMTR
jgi:hypothetical protein